MVVLQQVSTPNLLFLKGPKTDVKTFWKGVCKDALSASLSDKYICNGVCHIKLSFYWCSHYFVILVC